MEGRNATKYSLTNGRSKFNYNIGKEIMEDFLDAEGTTFVDAETTPSVTAGIFKSTGEFAFGNTGATPVTDFDDAVTGIEFRVRLDANTTIVHATSLIRCKGGVNIVGSSTDEFVTFRSYSGVWVEMWRNF